MPVQTTYFNPLSFQQAAPMLSGLQAGTDIAGSAGLNALRAQQTQQAAIQNRYLPSTLSAQLQGLQLGNTNKGIQNQYLPQGLQAGINLQNSQAGLAGSEAAKNNFLLKNPAFMSSGIGGQIGQTGYLEQNYPGLFGGNQQQAAPQITSNNGGMTIQPNNGSYSPIPQNMGAYQTLPGGLTSQQGQQVNQQLSTQNGQPSGSMTMGLNGLQNQGWQPQGGLSPLQNMQMSMFTLPLLQKQAQTQYYNMRSAPFNNLTPDMKNQVLAQANSFGYTPDAAAQQLSQGKNLSDLAQSKGLGNDPSTWPEPNYAPTGAQRTWYQRRNASAAELEPIQNDITAGLTPYARRFDGYSPSQIVDAIKGDNPDQQARYFAATNLLPDFQALKLKIMGGEVNGATMNQILDSSMLKFKSLYPTVSPAVFAKTQQLTQQYLNQALGVSNKVGLMPPGTAAPSSSPTPVSMPSFNSKAEFQSWYKSQDAGTQAQIKQQLGGG